MLINAGEGVDVSVLLDWRFDAICLPHAYLDHCRSLSTILRDCSLVYANTIEDLGPVWLQFVYAYQRGS